MYNWSFLFVVLHKPTLLPSTFKFGTVEVSKLRPTNNDTSSHAVKLQAQTTGCR